MRKKLAFWIKIKKARIIYLKDIFIKEVYKIALATIILQFVLAGSLYVICKRTEISSYFEKKTVILQVAEAKITKFDVITDTKEPKTEEKSPEEIADYIHFRESNRGSAPKGLHITCKSKGLSNEYGYNPPKCYDNNDQVRLIVIDWIKRHRDKGMTDNELLLLYSNNGYGI